MSTLRSCDIGMLCLRVVVHFLLGELKSSRGSCQNMLEEDRVSFLFSALFKLLCNRHRDSINLPLSFSVRKILMASVSVSMKERVRKKESERERKRERDLCVPL